VDCEEQRPKGKAAEYFRAREERTSGNVVVEVYPNSVLYKDGEELDMLQLGGGADAGAVPSRSSALWGQGVRGFDLPSCSTAMTTCTRSRRGRSARRCEELEAKGITGSLLGQGFKVMSANRPLRLPEISRGSRLRIQSSKVLDQEMRRPGAMPQVTALSEATRHCRPRGRTARRIRRRSVYAEDARVQKYVAVSNHATWAMRVIVNRVF